VVAVRPQTISRCEVARTGEVAHRPETRPETTHVTLSRERNTGLEMSTLVAKLVPRLDHSRSVLEPVVLEKIELEDKSTVLGVSCIGIVPLQFVRDMCLVW
jgi:hypothetical protein